MFTKNYFKALYGDISNTANLEFIDISGVAKTVNSGNINYYKNLHKIGDVSNSYYARLDTFNKNAKASGNYMNGVTFGDGSGAPTMDDYALMGNHITEYSGSASITKELDNEGVTIRCIYTITNTSAAAFTVSEIGLYGCITNAGLVALVERTVLDSPVTIPAGGVGQVTYTIRMNYPT